MFLKKGNNAEPSVVTKNTASLQRSPKFQTWRALSKFTQIAVLILQNLITLMHTSMVMTVVVYERFIVLGAMYEACTAQWLVEYIASCIYRWKVMECYTFVHGYHRYLYKSIELMTCMFSHHLARCECCLFDSEYLLLSARSVPNNDVLIGYSLVGI